MRARCVLFSRAVAKIFAPSVAAGYGGSRSRYAGSVWVTIYVNSAMRMMMGIGMPSSHSSTDLMSASGSCMGMNENRGVPQPSAECRRKTRHERAHE